MCVLYSVQLTIFSLIEFVDDVLNLFRSFNEIIHNEIGQVITSPLTFVIYINRKRKINLSFRFCCMKRK